MEQNLVSLWEEISVLVSCSAVFIAIYFLAFFGVFCSWKRKSRFEAASCCMSLVHGTTATFMASYDVFRSPWNLSAPNTAFQEKLMEFSSAYFLVDLFHYALFVPDEPLFILHHIATTTYILSCRYYTHHGAVSVVALLGLAESTSTLQNIWTLARLASDDSFAARRIYHGVYPFFIVAFSFVRGVLGPCLTWNLCKYYFTGQADSVIPRWLVSYWMTTVILAISGSLFWISGQWASFLSLSKEKVYRDAKLNKSE